MNVLYIHTNEERDKEIFAAFAGTDAVISEYTAPTPEEANESYAPGLLKAMEESGADVVFATAYFPIVSIACEAMKKKYIAYCQRPYNPSLYSCTLVNEANLVFVPDYTVYENFNREGFTNVLFMPLGVAEEAIASDVTEEDSEGEEGVDLTITQNVASRDSLPLNLLTAASPLKDSTKGYLEGCIACRHQIRGLPSMYQYLPPYIKEDIGACIKMDLAADSVENAASYFDNRSFNDLVTVADRDIHFGTLFKNDHFRKIRIYGNYSGSVDKTSDEEDRKWDISSSPSLARGPEFASAVRKSKINLIIPHRNWLSGISGRTFDTFAAGGFVMSPVMGDIVGLFEPMKEVLYVDEFNMASRSVYYKNHPTERIEIVNSVLSELRKNHTYLHRIEGMFANI